MSGDSRWSITEMIARYELEPQLGDVFVEGHFDKEVLTRAFSRSSIDAIFYEIGAVEVPVATLAEHNLTLGNKQRLIAFARELETLPPSARVVCLVDRDLDHWFGPLNESVRLRWTYFSCIESHFLDSEVIDDILVATGRAKISNLERFTFSLFEVLRALYALRLADRELEMSLRWVALRKYLARTGDEVVFDIERYIAAVLGSNALLPRRGSFLAAFVSWKEKLICDIRLAMRGHDYAEILAWAMTQFQGHKEFRSPESIERLFVLLAKSVASFSQELTDYAPIRPASAQLE